MTEVFSEDRDCKRRLWFFLSALYLNRCTLSLLELYLINHFVFYAEEVLVPICRAFGIHRAKTDMVEKNFVSKESKLAKHVEDGCHPHLAMSPIAAVLVTDWVMLREN